MTAAAGPVRTDDLIADCQGLVKSLARQVHAAAPRHTDLDDLIGYGQVGLAEAARGFNPNVNVKFSTFAYYRIRGAIFDGLSKMAWFHQPAASMLRFGRQADAVLADAAEASDRGGMADDLLWLSDVSRTLAVVYLTSQAAASAEGDEDDPAASAADRELFGRLHESIDSLSAEAASLVRAVYFEGLTLQEAGERLGISKSWASRLHGRALDRLGRDLRRLGED